MLFGVREVLNHNKFVVKHNQSVKAEMKAFCVEIRFKFLVDCDVVRSSNRPWVMMRLVALGDWSPWAMDVSSLNGA